MHYSDKQHEIRKGPNVEDVVHEVQDRLQQWELRTGCRDVNVDLLDEGVDLAQDATGVEVVFKGCINVPLPELEFSLQSLIIICQELRILDGVGSQRGLHALEELLVLGVLGVGLEHRGGSVVHLVVVLVEKVEETEAPVRVLFQLSLDRDEVLQALRHLLALDVEMPAMEPVVAPLRNHTRYEGLAYLIALVERFRLSDFILVMREPEVDATGVDVQALPEAIAGHNRALDMPPGPSPTPWGFPLRLSLLRRLPQREVRWV